MILQSHVHDVDSGVEPSVTITFAIEDNEEVMNVEAAIPLEENETPESSMQTLRELFQFLADNYGHERDEDENHGD